VPAFAFVGFPFGREFDDMNDLLEVSGYSSKDLIVMCRIGEGIAFVFDPEALKWVEDSAFRLKNRLSEGVSACVGAFITVTSGTFTLGTIGRFYALFPLGNTSIMRSPTGEGDADLIAIEMRAWEVTTLGAELFEHCFNLRLVALPSSMKDIDDWTFGCCESLECVSLVGCPSLERVGEQAFFGCTALREVILPGSVIDISFRPLCLPVCVSSTLRPVPPRNSDLTRCGDRSLRKL
jgi:hypothetical protein